MKFRSETYVLKNRREISCFYMIVLLCAGVFGPPIGCYSVVFVDDVSMPQAETYGAQPPIEVLRQGIDLGLWYDRKTNAAMHLIDVQVLIMFSLFN